MLAVCPGHVFSPRGVLCTCIGSVDISMRPWKGGRICNKPAAPEWGVVGGSKSHDGMTPAASVNAICPLVWALHVYSL